MDIGHHRVVLPLWPGQSLLGDRLGNAATLACSGTQWREARPERVPDVTCGSGSNSNCNHDQSYKRGMPIKESFHPLNLLIHPLLDIVHPPMAPNGPRNSGTTSAFGVYASGVCKSNLEGTPEDQAKLYVSSLFVRST